MMLGPKASVHIMIIFADNVFCLPFIAVLYPRHLTSWFHILASLDMAIIPHVLFSPILLS